MKNTSTLLPLALLLSCGIFAESTRAATLPAFEDTFGFRAKLTTSANKATNLPVDATHTTYIYFNLGDLPAGASIRYARLRIYLPKIIRAGSGLTVHEVTGSWDESLASAEPTINPTAIATLPSADLKAKGFISVDITAAAQTWLATPVSNEGIAIVAVPNAVNSLVADLLVGAKEGNGSGYPAELDVELNPADGSIGSDQLAPGLTLGGTTIGTFSGNGAALTSVNALTIADGAISTAKLADNAVQTGKIASGAVGTSELADGSVTNPKLALGAVGSSQLASNLTLGGTTSGTFSGDGSGLTNINADTAATAETVSDGAITSSKIASGGVGADALADGVITLDKLDPALAAALQSLINGSGTLPPVGITIDFVPVGSAGNSNDGATGLGAVGYEFEMGKYEITNTQYCAFLNAVADTDTYGLWIPTMAEDTLDGYRYDNTTGILRSGTQGSYAYTVKAGRENLFLARASLLNAIRFCNWLHNGQPQGVQDAATTEDGAYKITGGVSVSARNAGAKYFIPNENEWCKAAYYDPTKVGGAGFWRYPTRTDSAPTAATPNSNNANSANYAGVMGGFGAPSAKGAYTLATNYFGTFDQGANAWEWTEQYGLRGGSYFINSAVHELHFGTGRMGPVIGDITTGIVGKYLFSGNANDSSGSDKHATVNGASLTTDRFGNASSAYAFSGSSYISGPNLLTNFQGSATISCWIKSSSITGVEQAAVCLPRPAGDYGGFRLGVENGRGDAGLNTQGFSGEPIENKVVLGSATIANNAWHHMVATADGSTLKLYFDGVFFGSTTFVNNGVTSTQGIQIGREGTVGRFFTGNIDDVLVYNRPLSANDVAALYSVQADANAGVGGGFAVGFRVAKAAEMQFVTVGSPGNPADPTLGLGAVAYSFKIGKYEVTNAQYVELLNAVATTDTWGLYNTFMTTDAQGGILRSGESGSYNYAVKSGYGTLPVNYMSYCDAVRFCNWMHNGKPIGLQSASTTEDGAYLITGGTTVEIRKVGANYFLPNENEWVKAGYYDPEKINNGGYWLYPTRSNEITNSRNGSISDSNSANYYYDDAIPNGYNGGFAVTNTTFANTPAGTLVLTPVGAFKLTTTYYGTFDQAGNVEEWVEAPPGGGTFHKGASAFGGLDVFGATWQNPHSATADTGGGFRIAKP